MSTASALRSTPARMLRNLRFQAVAQAYGAAINMLLPVLVVHVGVVGFEVYRLGFVLWAIFRVLADYGLYTLCVRDVAQAPEKLAAYQRAQMRIRRVSGAVCLAVMAGLSFVAYDPRTHAAILGTFAIAMVLETMAEGYRWTFRATQQMGRDAIAAMIEKSCTLAFTLVAVFAVGSFVACAAAIAAGQLVNLLAARSLARASTTALAEHDPALVSYLWRWSPTFMAMGATFVLYQMLDFVLLERWSAVPRAMVALYGLAYYPFKGLQMVPEVVMMSIFPALAELHHADRARLEGTVRATFRYVVGLSVAAAAAVVLLHRPLAHFLLILEPSEKSYGRDLAPMLTILILAAPLYAMTSITGHILAATRRQVRLSAIYVIALSFNLAGNVLYAIPTHGAMGCAVMTVLTEALLQTLLTLNLPDGLTRVLLPRSLALTALVAAAFAFVWSS